MRLGHIEIFVSDPMTSLPFYRDTLGFSVVEVQGERYVWLAFGAVEVLLRPGEEFHRGATYQAAGMGLVLYCHDLHSTADMLRRRGVRFAGTDGSPDCLTFTGPDGEWFQLVQQD